MVPLPNMLRLIRVIAETRSCRLPSKNHVIVHLESIQASARSSLGGDAPKNATHGGDFHASADPPRRFPSVRSASQGEGGVLMLDARDDATTRSRRVPGGVLPSAPRWAQNDPGTQNICKQPQRGTLDRLHGS